MPKALKRQLYESDRIEGRTYSVIIHLLACDRNFK